MRAAQPPSSAQVENRSVDDRFRAAKAMAKGLATKFSASTHLADARAFCFAMLDAHWRARCQEAGCKWQISKGPLSKGPTDEGSAQLAELLGRTAASFHPNRASYLLGTVYTAMLPSGVRSDWGAYYTPPPYVERLMDLAEQAGFDWSKGKAIDPACGGGAFLTPVALRMLAATPAGSPEFRLARITTRLRGAELDPFAAWMSHVLLESALLGLCLQAGKRLPSLIRVGDSLDLTEPDEYDLVIGNPPYSRVSLTPAHRQKYERSLYGHANLYGLFTDLAVRLVKQGGIVAYVTPTSFLGGQYFKALRELLIEQAPPQRVDFMGEREGVFDDVLQETLLAVYKKGVVAAPIGVSCLSQVTADTVTVEPLGNVDVPRGSAPWLLPRDATQARFITRLRDLPCRLADLGYAVSTGPLVWNRHKEQLRTASKGKRVYPLVWAESVTSNEFSFRASRRNHVPFIQVTEEQSHLVTADPCVLVQRTTAKEQARRLVAAVVPEEFLQSYGAVVVENHLNLVRPSGPVQVSPTTLSVLLNSKAADTAFRCISGSVAVSAYELNALPLPSLKELRSIDRLVLEGASPELVEKRLNRSFGLS